MEILPEKVELSSDNLHELFFAIAEAIRETGESLTGSTRKMIGDLLPEKYRSRSLSVITATIVGSSLKDLRCLSHITFTGIDNHILIEFKANQCRANLRLVKGE